MKATPALHALLDNICMRIGLIESPDATTTVPLESRIDEVIEYFDDVVNENSLLNRKLRAAVLGMRRYGRHATECSVYHGNDCSCGWETVRDGFPEVKAL